MTLAVLMNLGFAGSASADTEPPTAQPVWIQVATARAMNRLFVVAAANNAAPVKSRNSVTTE